MSTCFLCCHVFGSAASVGHCLFRADSHYRFLAIRGTSELIFDIKKKIVITPKKFARKLFLRIFLGYTSDKGWNPVRTDFFSRALSGPEKRWSGCQKKKITCVT